MANLTITQAASAITDLINSRSSSPRHDELVAIIAQTQGHSPLPDAHAERMEWRRLSTAYHAANSVWGDFAPGDESAAAMAALAAADAAWGALREFEQRLWGRPAKWEDLPVLAEACFRHMWPGDVLHQPGSDALLARGLQCYGGACDEALAALLRAIRDLAQCKGRHDDPQTSATEPTSPLAEKIRNLLPQVQTAITASTDTEAKAKEELGISPNDFPEHVAAEKHAMAMEDQLQALVDEAWAAPVRTFGDAVLLAEIAQHQAHDWPAIGESDGLTNPTFALEAFGRLTMAVLTLAGRPFNAQPVAAPEFAVRTRTGTVMVCDVSRQRVQEIRDI